MEFHFRSNDLEGQLWQQRTANRLVPVRPRVVASVKGVNSLRRVRLD
jgi:hypothetical protein